MVAQLKAHLESTITMLENRLLQELEGRRPVKARSRHDLHQQIAARELGDAELVDIAQLVKEPVKEKAGYHLA